MPLASFSQDNRELVQMLFAGVSLSVTLYFWFVRANRERVSVAVFSIQGFQSSLEPGGVGLWSGRLFVANRSIMPTAIVLAKAELWWHGSWIAGNVGSRDGSELPWNLPPSLVQTKDVCAAFDVGADVPLELLYADQRLRFTFLSIEGSRVSTELRTNTPQILEDAGFAATRRAA